MCRSLLVIDRQSYCNVEITIRLSTPTYDEDEVPPIIPQPPTQNDD